MNPIAWDPPAVALAALGVVLVVAWMALSPPGRSVRGLLRGAAACLLLLALFDVGCRGESGARGRIIVLLDRSRSMDVAGPGGETRAGAAEAWLASSEFAAWTSGWEVEVDSFGGATTDVAGALEAAASEAPEAVVLVSDGRAAGGRAAEPVGIPLYAFVPEPAHLPDLALVDVTISVEEGAPVAVATVASVGGAPWTAPRELAVAVDDEVVARTRIAPPLEPGERRRVTLPLPTGARGTRVVEARLDPEDPVGANDRRARTWDAGSGPRRILVVGLAPLWEMAAFRRVFEASVDLPVDAFWSPGMGELRGSGPDIGPEAWASVPTRRYRVAAMFGDPARLGAAGAAWLERFAGAGGRGVMWAPQGYAGPLPGLAMDVPGGAEAARPELTAAGRAWLVRRGPVPDVVPDGSEGWPPLEALPGATLELAGAVPLLAAAGRPVAWAAESDVGRRVLLLGTGYYRWPLSGAGAARFWEAWSRSLVRWLVAAEATERPLVRLPEGGRVSAEAVEIGRVVETEEEIAWRIENAAGEIAARGSLPAEGAREILAGPLEPGTYAVVVEAGGRTGRERLVVEARVPDLAWTAADTTGVAAAARASGGGWWSAGEPPEPIEAAVARAGGTTRGLASSPWAYLAAALLLLLDWGLGARGGRAAGASDEPGPPR